MRWIALLCVVAACGGEESNKQDPPPAPPVARITAPVPPDAGPPPDAEPRVVFMTEENRKTLDRLESLDEAKFSGLPEDGPTVELEGSSGDYRGLTKEQVDRVVKSRKGTIKACYQREAEKSKDLAGKLVIAFTIDAEGKVGGASVDEGSTLDNTAVQQCVKRQIIKLKFPAGGGAAVKYPFLFSHG